MNSIESRPDVCQHGAFRCSCGLCERDAEIARLLPYETAAKEWVASMAEDGFDDAAMLKGFVRPGLKNLYKLVKDAKP